MKKNILLALLLGIFITGCTPSATTQLSQKPQSQEKSLVGSDKKESGFIIYLASPEVSKKTFSTDELSKNYEKNPFWQKLLKEGTLYEIFLRDEDIESYKMFEDTITINPQASLKLKEKINKESTKINNGFFIATLNGKRLYAGEILKDSLSPGDDAPALYYASQPADSKNNFLTFSITPTPSRAWLYKGMLSNTDIKKFNRIKQEEIYDFLLQQRKLQGHGFSSQVIELADKFKALREERENIYHKLPNTGDRLDELENELGSIMDTLEKELNRSGNYIYKKQRIVALLGEPDGVINQLSEPCIGPSYACEALRPQKGETYFTYRWRGMGLSDVDGKWLSILYFVFDKNDVFQKVGWIGFNPETEELSQKFKAARTYLKENKPSEVNREEMSAKQNEYRNVLNIFREKYGKPPYTQIDIEYLMGSADFISTGEDSLSLNYETEPGLNVANWLYFSCDKKGIVQEANFISP